MAKKSVKIDNLLTLLPKFFGENDVLGIFLRGWLCNLPELHVFVGIQYSSLLQEALNKISQIQMRHSANKCHSTPYLSLAKRNRTAEQPAHRAVVQR